MEPESLTLNIVEPVLSTSSVLNALNNEVTGEPCNRISQQDVTTIFLQPLLTREGKICILQKICAVSDDAKESNERVLNVILDGSDRCINSDFNNSPLMLETFSKEYNGIIKQCIESNDLEK